MAKIMTRSDSRQNLSDILPLQVPLSVYIQASNVCNFRCNYCAQTLDNQKLKDMKIERDVMSYELFDTIATQLQDFGGKIKTINLTGFGEPLLNRNIHDMVARCKVDRLCERTEIVTNGSRLTADVADRLINAELDLLRISVQGLSNAKYKQISDVDFDVHDFIQNLSYFYKNKKNTRVYIKILDAALEAHETPEDFYRMFGDVCDDIAVEHLVPVMPEVDYSKMGSFDVGMVGYKNATIQVCPRPFYMLTVNIDGSVRPCCNYLAPAILGNVKTATLKELWEGPMMNSFRVMMLEKSRAANGVCKTCQTPVYGLHSEDNLDNCTQTLIPLYSTGDAR